VKPPRAVIVVALTLVVSVGPAAAASLALSDRDRTEALRLGQRSVTNETFGGEWRVVNGSGESVSVITPFHRLALAARHAAFKNEPLKPQDQQRMLDELKDRLIVEVSLLGPRTDFARYLTPRLVLGDVEIQPLLVQNERTAVRQQNGNFLARCRYSFPNKEIEPSSQLVLLVRDPDGELVARFPIDLARMR
jgi:hypothetical protein